MNEDTLLLEFLEEYLNGLDMVSQYEAVKVGISMLLSEGVFNNTVEISGLLKINYGTISCLRSKKRHTSSSLPLRKKLTKMLPPLRRRLLMKLPQLASRLILTRSHSLN